MIITTLNRRRLLVTLAAALTLGVSHRVVAQQIQVVVVTNAQPWSAAEGTPVDLSAVLGALLGGGTNATTGQKADLSALENMVLFHPMKDISATPEKLKLKFEDVTITTADGVKLNAWWVPCANARATLLLSHGNAGNIGHRLEKLKIFHSFGLNVLMYDYRGFGKSEGTPNEKGLYADVQAAYDFLAKKKAVPANRIISYGESLGGSVAAYAASTNKVGALILDSSFTSVKEMAAAMSPMLANLTQAGLDTGAALKNVNAPVLVLHSPTDEIVPYAQAKKNFNAAKEPKQFVELKGDHNDGFLTSGETYTKGINKFLDTHFQQRR